jgi:hypothetical protein
MMKLQNVWIAAATFTGLGHAQQLEVVYCEIPASGKSVVPGALDAGSGLPEATTFRALENVFVSPDGTSWMLKGRTQQGNTEENILLLGGGTSGTMFAQEGQPVPGGLAGEVVDFFGSGVGRFNSLNDFAYSARARGGSSAVFQKVIYWDGSTSTVVRQMGDLYTGLVDQLPNVSGDETVGNSIGSIHPLDDGRVGAQDSTIGSIHSSKRPASFYDAAAFHQADTTTVLNLAGSGSLTIDGVSSNSFYTSPDGAHWVAVMDLDPSFSSNNSLVYDGQVVVENGQAIPGTSVTSGAVFNAEIAANGDWFGRGRDNSGTSSSAPDWAVRSGTLVAKTGDALTGSENYGETFYAFTGNAVGDWVMTCTTDDANPATDSVLVWNGQVVAREGDPVDVDGNGAFDDGAFLGRGTNTLSAFQPDDLALTDANTVFVLAALNDGAGGDLGSVPAFGTPDVLLRIQLGGGVVAYCTAGTSASGCQASLSASGSASASASSGFDVGASAVEGLKDGLFFYGQSGRQANSWGTSSSYQCVVPPVKRGGLLTGVGTSGLCDGSFSQDLNARWCPSCPKPTHGPTAGQKLQLQLWHRDPFSTSNRTTSLSGALEVDVAP